MGRVPVTCPYDQSAQGITGGKPRLAHNALAANRRTVLIVPSCWSPLTTVAYLKAKNKSSIGLSTAVGHRERGEDRRTRSLALLRYASPNSVATYITHAPPPLHFPPQRRCSMTLLVVTMLALAVSTRTGTLAYIVYRLLS